jgi:hypothetical protein
MHAREPPRKLIVFPHTPGIPAGNVPAPSQRVGFHSSASGPQRRWCRLSSFYGSFSTPQDGSERAECVRDRGLLDALRVDKRP